MPTSEMRDRIEQAAGIVKAALEPMLTTSAECPASAPLRQIRRVFHDGAYLKPDEVPAIL